MICLYVSHRSLERIGGRGGGMLYASLEHLEVEYRESEHFAYQFGGINLEVECHKIWKSAKILF